MKKQARRCRRQSQLIFAPTTTLIAKIFESNKVSPLRLRQRRGKDLPKISILDRRSPQPFQARAGVCTRGLIKYPRQELGMRRVRVCANSISRRPEYIGAKVAKVQRIRRWMSMHVRGSRYSCESRADPARHENAASSP